jgi:putative PIN family toxin of toxin-antitoxin system
MFSPSQGSGSLTASAYQTQLARSPNPNPSGQKRNSVPSVLLGGLWGYGIRAWCWVRVMALANWIIFPGNLCKGIIGNTMRQAFKIVIDTNVLVAALRSRTGWSFDLLARIGQGQFQHVVTVPLVMEYEDVLLRPGLVRVPAAAVSEILDYVCATAIRQSVHFLWRPRLPDVKDDMVLEAAVNGQCDAIVTWNVRDFSAASEFGVAVLNPATFLDQQEEWK